MGVPAGGGGGSNPGKLSGKKFGTEIPGWNAQMHFLKFYFFIFPTPSPPWIQPEETLGIFRGSHGGCRWGEVTLEDIIEINIYKFI